MKHFFLVLAMLAAASFLLVSCAGLTANKNAAQSNSGSTSAPKKIETVKNSLGMEFVKISAGSFTMGSPEGEEGRFGGELQHQVTLTKDFYLGTTEVTVGQWKAVMGSVPGNFNDGGDNSPVADMTWDNVQEFIKKLNAKGEGTYRLPTEAEWEYAARAGTTDKYNESNLDDIAWYKKNSDYKRHPVGQKKANAWGLYDMHGNVSEWVADYGGSSPKSDSVTDPKGPESGTQRMIRGGSAADDETYVRSSSASVGMQSGHFNYTGFRVVKE